MVWLAILCPPLALILLAARAGKKKDRPRHEGGDVLGWRIALVWVPLAALAGWLAVQYGGWV